MKKGLLIVMSVAILGALGLYVGRKPSTPAAASTTASASASDTSDMASADPDAASSQSADSDSKTGSSTSGSSSSSSKSGQSTKSVSSKSTPVPSDGKYKNGTYTGSSAQTPYGTVQIAVVVSGGKITDVNFLQMPSDEGHSQEVTSFAEPQLKQETILAQSASIDFVSGATSTSFGYEQSLQAALDQALNS